MSEYLMYLIFLFVNWWRFYVVFVNQPACSPLEFMAVLNSGVMH